MNEASVVNQAPVAKEMLTPLPQVVLLDRASLNPADLDFSALQALPVKLTMYDHTAPAETAARLAAANIAICNKVVIDAAVMAACPGLRAIAVTATGLNNIDLAAANARGITVMNVSGYGTRAVAQHTFALLLALTNQIQAYARDAVNGRWSQSPTFCLSDHPVRDLDGATLGVIGYGALGREVAALATAFGMTVLVAEGEGGAQPGRLPLDEVLARADIVTLHTLLTPRTEKFINAERLAQMKPGALLVNTARGGLVDEAALLAALQSGHLGGAALDVVSVEPPPADHPLLTAGLPNLLITPHCAWVSRGARQRLLDGTVDNLRNFLAAAPAG
ncbi:MAG: D-2-hydroxyacid dehydrogenase [Moraxellaceae bacterium]|nr:D-2-hydroxyacid dehydrogenase [Moraxellaceae bacterium]